MKLTKTRAKSFLKIISTSKKRFFSCEDLSKVTGLKIDTIYTYVEEFYPMIRLDVSCNLKDLLKTIEKYIVALEKATPIKKKKRISTNEYDKYESFIDYIYKNMTISGGILDTGYILNAKDKRMLKHFLNKKSK